MTTPNPNDRPTALLTRATGGTLGMAMAAALALVPFPAAAHWDLPSCYIEVNDGCFNTDPPCSDEDYQGFLDDCDDAYPSVAVARPGYIATGGPTRAQLSSSAYKRKVETIRRTFAQ